MAFICYSFVLAGMAAAYEWPDAFLFVVFLVGARVALRHC